MNSKCTKCGGPIQSGLLQARNASSITDFAEPGTRVMRFCFVLPGTPISWNPITAFKQGLAEEPSDQLFPLVARRCTECGYVEMYAGNE